MPNCISLKVFDRQVKRRLRTVAYRRDLWKKRAHPKLLKSYVATRARRRKIRA